MGRYISEFHTEDFDMQTYIQDLTLDLLCSVN